jgi:hypothetical protein
MGMAIFKIYIKNKLWKRNYRYFLQKTKFTLTRYSTKEVKVLIFPSYKDYKIVLAKLNIWIVENTRHYCKIYQKAVHCLMS